MNVKIDSLKRRGRRLGRKALLEVTLAARRPMKGSCPDFVIVGAQRSGTTSLFRALAAHPSMLSNALGAKGSHFFDTGYHRSPAWFRSHFASQAQRHSAAAKRGQPAVVGEANPYYLFHPTAIERMASIMPDARLIVLLRDPIARAHSHYQHMVWEGHETLPTFEQALDAEPERLAGEEQRIVNDVRYRSLEHQHHSYVARGKYASQVKRALKFYPRDRILILATETLTSNPAPHLRAIQEFVGLAPHPSVVLERRNAGSYSSMAPSTRRVLEEAFAESNAQLSELTGNAYPWV